MSVGCAANRQVGILCSRRYGLTFIDCVGGEILLRLYSYINNTPVLALTKVTYHLCWRVTARMSLVSKSGLLQLRGLSYCDRKTLWAYFASLFDGMVTP